MRRSSVRTAAFRSVTLPISRPFTRRHPNDVTFAPPESPVLRGVTPPSGSDPRIGGRFPPGTLLAGRYRIVGIVGKGGMGEVYRAEDLTLGQVVPLKFLPPSLVRDPSG